MPQSTEPIRRHKPIVLLLLIGAAFVLMAVQLRSPGKVATAGRWSIAVFTPLFQAGAWSSGQFRSAAAWALSTQVAQQENRQLRRDNAELRSQVSMLRESMAKMQRERALALSAIHELGLVYLYADVIAMSAQRWVRALVVDKGKVDGVRAGMPVIDYTGAVVGIVVEVIPASSIVRLLNDPGFQIGAMIQSSREQGMVHGTGEANRLRFKPNEPQKPLEVGMEIISSGFEGSPYPKGLKIGVISAYRLDEYGMAYAEVEPTAEFARLEEVLLVDTQSTSGPRRQAPAGDEPGSEAEAAPSAPSPGPMDEEAVLSREIPPFGQEELEADDEESEVSTLNIFDLPMVGDPQPDAESSLDDTGAAMPRQPETAPGMGTE